MYIIYQNYCYHGEATCNNNAVMCVVISHALISSQWFIIRICMPITVFLFEETVLYRDWLSIYNQFYGIIFFCKSVAFVSNVFLVNFHNYCNNYKLAHAYLMKIRFCWYNYIIVVVLSNWTNSFSSIKIIALCYHSYPNDKCFLHRLCLYINGRQHQLHYKPMKVTWGQSMAVICLYQHP